MTMPRNAKLASIALGVTLVHSAVAYVFLAR